MRKIGAHVSIAGGIDQAIDRAKNIGANCVQIFSGTPRSWSRLNLQDINVDKITSKQHKLSVSPIIIHGIYLINLASDRPNLVQRSQKIIEYDLQLDALIKGGGVVVHLGSHLGKGWTVVRQKVAKHLQEILAQTPQNSHLLIENSAGQKGKLCSDLTEIRWLLDQLKSNRVGWCYDTCHGFGAGYSLANPESSKKKAQIKYVVDEISRLNLWSSLRLIHVNDSRGEFASGVDRHANLGQGLIPQSDFKYFLNHPKIKKLPLILEVPGFDKNGPDQDNIKILKTWVV